MAADELGSGWDERYVVWFQIEGGPGEGDLYMPRLAPEASTILL